MKLYAHHTVAEALSFMNNNNVDCLAVYSKETAIGKISYAELLAFLDHGEKLGNINAHKLHFDLKSVLAVIRTIQTEQYQMAQKKARLKKRLTTLSSAAVIAIACFFAWLFFKPFHSDATGQAPAVPYTKDITLTLANGMEFPLNASKEGIVINASKLSYHDGTVVFSQKNNEKAPMVLRTPKKGIFQVSLPDGTRVWLNATSQLSFPSSFPDSSKRSVHLKGEAYFEVAKMYGKNGRIPFIVLTDKQEIEVLGTHFNVRAYPNTAIKTTLLEGAVRVTPMSFPNLAESTDPAITDPLMQTAGNPSKALQLSQAVLLKPNQEATLTTQALTVKPVNAAGAIAWTKKDFSFRNMPLETIMNVVASWYDVDIIYQYNPAGSVLLGGTIQRSEQLDELLNTLSLASNMHFKVQGRQITVVKVK